MSDLWEHRKPKGGSLPIYQDPESLWSDCVRYFEWVKKNPLIEHKAFQYQGVPFAGEIEKPRAMHLNALCLHLGIHVNTWISWRKQDGHHLAGVVHDVESIIAEQKFTGAAAGIFDAGLMGRDLGLVDKKATEHSGIIESVTHSAEDYKAAQHLISQKLDGLD